MGNFYTNFTIFGTDLAQVANVATGLHRKAYLIKSGANVVFCDERCDEQDTDEIEALGKTLSAKLGVPILGCLNHDDDHLFLWLFQNGNKRAFYQSIINAPKFSWSLSRVRGGLPTFPIILFILAWPIVIFQVFRHQMLGTFISLPRESVGLGYRYLSRGENPYGISPQDIERI